MTARGTMGAPAPDDGLAQQAALVDQLENALLERIKGGESRLARALQQISRRDPRQGDRR